MELAMSEFTERLIESHINLYGEIEPNFVSEYSFAYLSKTDFKENDIFTIRIVIDKKSERIGWLFPLIALGSKEHDYGECPHFGLYAKIGGAIISSCSKKNYDENTQILILKDAKLLEAEAYVGNLTIPLMEYGYYPVVSGVKFQNKLCLVNNVSTKSLSVKKSPAVHDYLPYIKNLMSELLPKTTDPLSRFLSIYQVYELLMEKFFHLKVEEYRNKRITIGTIRENMAELSSERKLMNLVFQFCELRTSPTEDERNLARRLFDSDKEDSYYEKLSLQGLIYDLRNAIVHNYHRYELTSLMLDISERMEVIFVELLGSSKVSLLLTEPR
jgi:hypothetical protein